MTVVRCTSCDWRDEGWERGCVQAAHEHANTKGHRVEVDDGRTIRPLQTKAAGKAHVSVSARGFRAVADDQDATDEALRRMLRAAAERIEEAVLANRAARMAFERFVRQHTMPEGRTASEIVGEHVRRERKRLQKGGSGTDG